MALNVNKWLAGRPKWNYCPTMQFFWRMVSVALMEAMEIGQDGTPTDEALLARDWFATSELQREFQVESQYVTFPKCCDALGVDVERERWGLLNLIDSRAESIGMDFDTDECWTRLEYLKSRSLSDDEDPIFAVPDWARVVPAIDQGALWPAPFAIGRRDKREKIPKMAAVPRAMQDGGQLGFLM